MAEYIDREAAKKEFNLNFGSVSHAVIANRILDAIPTADVVPVVYGEWLKTEEPLGWHDVDCVECSVCHESWIVDEDYGYDFLDFWHYCPNCGAHMKDGDGNG